VVPSWICLEGKGGQLAAGKDRSKSCFRQDALHFLAFVALDFDGSVLNCAADATGFLHFFREILLLREPDSDEVLCHGNSLPASMRRLADDIHAASIRVLLVALGGFCCEYRGGSRLIFGSCGQVAESVQRPKRIRYRGFFLACGFFGRVAVHSAHFTMDSAEITFFRIQAGMRSSLYPIKK
jgi:hypothetical protein